VGLTRTRLSREVCEWLNWRHGDGRVKEMNCRVALLRLERRGVIELPEARAVSFARRSGWESEPTRAWPKVAATLKELGRVWLEAVDSEDGELSREWWAMMAAHHPLGGGPLCGAQMRYLVSSAAGYLGGLSFSAAAWRLGARDEWIGWDEERRKSGLGQVVGNSRFLILPSVKVKNLASHVLGLAVSRVVRDWEARYGIRPELLETFVDRTRYQGTCYRAANWIRIGETEGRGRQDRERTAEREERRKDIWVYPLSPECQARLSSGSGVREAKRGAGDRRKPEDWAEEEFGGCQLGDARLTERLFTMARDFYARPMANVPQACSSRAKTKAAYRFLDHEETTMKQLLAGHYQATEARVGQQSVVLAVQDTTALNYTAHREMEGLGPISSKSKGSQGIYLHSTLAFDLAGNPLGFLDVQSWARDPKQVGKREARRKLPIEEKAIGTWVKSYRAVAAVQQRCPQTMLVSVGDREADFYEFFRETIKDPAGPKLLVRAKVNRKLADEQERLWQTMLARPVAGMQLLQVPRQGKRAVREAKLAIRFAAVTLLPPVRQGKAAPAIPVWAVMAEEQEPPQGVKPLKWMLLTTLTVSSFEAACEKLSWYTLRWGIEVLHRTLKSGCRIEQRQLGQVDRLEACLAIDLVVAWRIYHLCKLGREVPDMPCTIYFEEVEWKALKVFTTRNRIPPTKPPTINEAMRLVAGLGGFLGRNGDGNPGTQTLWLGLQRLDDIVSTYQVMIDATQPYVSSNSKYG
jgi:hypothetical protein